jgi:hypothetical protein
MNPLKFISLKYPIQAMLIFAFGVIFPLSSSYAQMFGGQIKSKNPNSFVIPSTITLAQNQRYFIASVNDNDYLPYSPPTATASTDALGADGTTETLVDVQGTLTTTGITVRIPVTVTGAGGTLPAFSQTINVPASLTEDGNC